MPIPTSIPMLIPTSTPRPRPQPRPTTSQDRQIDEYSILRNFLSKTLSEILGDKKSLSKEEVFEYRKIRAEIIMLYNLFLKQNQEIPTHILEYMTDYNGILSSI